MAESFSHEALLHVARQHIPDDPATFRFDPVRTGKHNSSFWVSGDSGRYVLRIAPPDDAGFLFYERQMMRQEPDLHRLIRCETDIPVARMVGYDFGRRIIDRDYIVMEALPGTPLSEARHLTPSCRDRALLQVGGYLRQLHSLTSRDRVADGAYGYLGAHKPMAPQSNWADAFGVMWNKLLDDVVASGTYSDAEARVFRDLYDTYRPVFDRPVAPCLLHMDVWAQNILVDATGNVTGLVDFDRALWGDVEIEFAVLDYCGISEPSFWAGYGADRDTSPEALIRQRFYLLYEVQKYMPIEVWRRKDLERAQGYKESCLKLAMGLVGE